MFKLSFFRDKIKRKGQHSKLLLKAKSKNNFLWFQRFAFWTSNTKYFCSFVYFPTFLATCADMPNPRGREDILKLWTIFNKKGEKFATKMQRTTLTSEFGPQRSAFYTPRNWFDWSEQSRAWLAPSFHWIDDVFGYR